MLAATAALVLRLILLALGLFMLAVAVAVRIQLEELAVLGAAVMVAPGVLAQSQDKQTRVAAVAVYGRLGLRQQVAPVS
jgi:hypothetical protein